jgi:hypothetical protein
MSATILKQSVFGKARVFFSAHLAAFFVLPSIFMLSAAAQAATLTVNSLADPGAAGICALRDAIAAANTMTATNGCPAGDGNDTIQFSVTGTILLASILPEVTDSQLTINGPASPGVTIDGGGKVQVMQIASGVTLNLYNVTIAHGSGEPSAAGGLVNQGTLIITKSAFLDNVSGADGSVGGILNEGTLSISESTFSGNKNSGSGSGDGAILNQAELDISNSNFSDNGSESFGGFQVGGIDNKGKLSINNSTFSANGTNADTGDGGILNDGTLIVANSTFSGNAGGGPAGAIENRGMATILGSTFFGNGAGANGGLGAGGITNGSPFSSSPAQAIIIDSSFSGNRGFHAGGGIANGVGSTLTLTNSTLKDDISNVGVASLKGTILAGKHSNGNCVSSIVLPSSAVPVNDQGYNMSDDGSCGFNAVGSLSNTDPMFDPAGLSNNGGSTQTIALLPGSPAIDAIPLASCTDQSGSPVATDQRGFPRPDAGENVCDIGAYEFQDNTTTSAVTITVPAAGGTVSGKVSIVAQVSAAVSWINVYVDGIYLTSSPPYSFTWDSSSVANGSHSISATAFDGSGTAIGSSLIDVSVNNTTPTAGVTLTAPNNGATVSGKVLIATQVSTQVSWINVYIDGIYLTSSPPYSFTWDSRSVTNGAHTISTTALDSSGTVIGTSSITVVVNNNSAVSITVPANGATVSGNVSIATQVSAAVSWINVYIDGIYLTSSPPYSFTWDSSSVPNGSHSISATAFDSSGTVIGSSLITVNVAN